MRPAEAIQADLQAVAAALDPAEAEVASLYARRLALWVEATALPAGTRPTAATLAAWTSTTTRTTTEGAVNQVLRKWRRAEAGEARRAVKVAAPRKRTRAAKAAR